MRRIKVQVDTYYTLPIVQDYLVGDSKSKREEAREEAIAQLLENNQYRENWQGFKSFCKFILQVDKMSFEEVAFVALCVRF